MLISILTILGINAIIQSILMSTYFLFTRRKPVINNRILAVLLVVFAILIFSNLPGGLWDFGKYWKVAHFTRRANFLIAPLFYFYIVSLLNDKFRFSKKDLFHIIPFAVALLSSIIEVQHWYSWGKIMILFSSPVIILQNFLYIFASFHQLRDHRLTIKSFMRSVTEAKLFWLRLFIGGYIVFWLITFQNFFLLKIVKLYNWCPYGGSLFFLTPFLFLNIITFTALIHPEIFKRPFVNKNTALNASFKKRYYTKLSGYMQDQKPYLDASLTLFDLSQQLSIPMKYLSQLINESFHQNFNDYINSYRIQESKPLLLDRSNGKTNILEIAYQVGFNSKTTFNSAFKKCIGCTPREFRQKSSYISHK